MRRIVLLAFSGVKPGEKVRLVWKLYTY